MLGCGNASGWLCTGTDHWHYLSSQRSTCADGNSYRKGYCRMRFCDSTKRHPECGRRWGGTYSYSFPFEIRCSLPSRVGVQSANGGLLATGAANFPAAGYSALAPYQVQLNLAGDAVTATGTCDANTLSSLAASPCNARGPATTTSGLLLAGASLAANPPDSILRVFSNGYFGADQLVASTNYADTLTVTISPNS
jgi:hypothetical protein